MVKDASVHDSQTIGELLDINKDGGQGSYADSAYTGAEQEKSISLLLAPSARRWDSQTFTMALR